MEIYYGGKNDVFSPILFSLESPNNKYIKSTIFDNNINDNKNIIKNNFNVKKPFHRRSLTPNNGNFLLNQIGHIKKDSKYETKKVNNNENKKINRRISSPDVKSFENKLLTNYKQKYNLEPNNPINENNNNNLDIQEKICTEDRYTKERIKNINNKKTKKFSLNKKYYRKKSESNKDVINNFDIKITKQDKSSLSFGEVDEENNEEDSNENNNDSSYISKIESKYVSMYDIDEELKELKEIGNNLKSPVYTKNIKNNNRPISSFSINNNETEKTEKNNNYVGNNGNNIIQKSILSHLKDMALKNNNENKINHNPIVFDDDLELSFHEDQTKKSNIKMQNTQTQLDTTISVYNSDKSIIKKFEYLNSNDKCNISRIEFIKNQKYSYSYKKDIGNIKRLSHIDLLLDITTIDNIRKKRYKINNSNDNSGVGTSMNIKNCPHPHHERRRNSKKYKNNNTNITYNKNKNQKKINNAENKSIKKREERNKKVKFNINNNTSGNINLINKENISLKNNYYINNTNELNKLIKEKINVLSMKNNPNIKAQNSKTISNTNKEEKKLDLTLISTSLNSQRELSFSNNDLLIIRENNIFCSGGDDQNINNITYNKYYNGNNITMNNFYNNYKLNDSNNNIVYNTEINNDNEYDSIYGNKNNNSIISELKNKLALKLKEEINKKGKNNLIKNPTKNKNKNKNGKKEDNLNGLNNVYRNNSLNKNLPKCASEIINQKNFDINMHLDNYNSEDFLKHNYNDSFSNYKSNYSNNLFLNLNPIREQNYAYNNNRKNKFENSSRSINKKYNNKKNISSQKQLLNKKTCKKSAKTPDKYQNNRIKSKLNNNNYSNNPINVICLNEKNICNNPEKKDVTKNSNYNLHNKSHFNNSILKNKKNKNVNKSMENISKNNNKIKMNYNSNRNNKNNVNKVKFYDFRNNRIKNEKNPIILTKNQISNRMNLDINKNSSVKHNESYNKLNNRNNIKNKITVNRTDGKTSIINKGKINNK